MSPDQREVYGWLFRQAHKYRWTESETLFRPACKDMAAMFEKAWQVMSDLLKEEPRDEPSV